MNFRLSSFVGSVLVIGFTFATTGCTFPATGGGGTSGTNGTNGSLGAPVEGTDGKPAETSESPKAKLAGSAWQMAKTSCKTATAKYVYQVCPNGRIVGAGEHATSVGRMVELQCGSYTVKDATYASCTDKVGCFPRINANVRTTLALGSEKDTWDGEQDLFFVEKDGALVRNVRCADESTGLMYMTRVNETVTNDDCELENASLCK
jgi:hypothetical protein